MDNTNYAPEQPLAAALANQQTPTPPPPTDPNVSRPPIAEQRSANLGQPVVSDQVEVHTDDNVQNSVDKNAKQTTERRKVREKLKDALGDSNEVLASAQTVFPFTLFPDTITIDRGKVDISHRSFFRVAEVTSIRIQDILNAIINVGPLFGSLKISTRFFGTDKVYTVNYLHRSDALKLKRILHGYIIALQKKIDCSALSAKELATLLDELGADS